MDSVADPVTPDMSKYRYDFTDSSVVSLIMDLHHPEERILGAITCEKDQETWPCTARTQMTAYFEERDALRQAEIEAENQALQDQIRNSQYNGAPPPYRAKG